MDQYRKRNGNIINKSPTYKPNLYKKYKHVQWTEVYNCLDDVEKKPLH